MRKKTKRKKKQCYYEDSCRWIKDSFSSEVKNYKGNRLNKGIKKAL